MWEFIKDNHGAIGAVATVLTLAIWALYFQLLLNSYRHRTRAKININRGGGHSSGAQCVVTNMSVKSVFVEGVFLTLRLGENWKVCSLSDLDNQPTGEVDYRSAFFQGPLASGEMIDIGSFNRLIERAQDAWQGGEPFEGEADHVEVLVVATYPGGDELVAAERRYDIASDGGRRLLKPTTFETRQIRSSKERRNVEKFMLCWYEQGTSMRQSGGRRQF